MGRECQGGSAREGMQGRECEGGIAREGVRRRECEGGSTREGVSASKDKRRQNKYAKIEGARERGRDLSSHWRLSLLPCNMYSMPIIFMTCTPCSMYSMVIMSTCIQCPLFLMGTIALYRGCSTGLR